MHPDFVHGDVYHNFVVGFRNPLVSAVYIVAMLALGLHLYHGVWSILQTLGLSHPRYNRLRHAFATLVTVVVVVGNISFPVAVLAGLAERAADRASRRAGRRRRRGALMELRSNVPDGPIEKKWEKHRFDMKLVNPANKRKYDVIVVGSGLAGGVRRGLPGRARLQRQVLLLPGQPAPRALHRRPGRHQRGQELPERRRQRLPPVLRHRQGRRLPRPRGQRLPPGRVSVNIIDQCVAQGVPFAREYGGTLANRSFGGAQVSRTFYARGQTGQQLLLGAYQALERQIGLGKVKMYPRHEMLDLVVVDGRARGIVTRDLVTGEIESHAARRRRPGHRRLRQRLLPRDQRQGLQRHRHLARLQEGRRLRQPLLHADPPHLHPGHRRPPVQAHADERVAAQRRPHLGAEEEGRHAAARPDPRGRARLLPRAQVPELRQPRARATSPRAHAKQVCDEGRGVGPSGLGVYLDFADAIKRLGATVIGEKYGNLFDMYERITDENPYKVPMRIYPAVHYTMGGLWVDYNLMSTIPGLFVLGEANFSDHGANRLGASALMQGLADGYFVIPYTIGNYLASHEARSGRRPTTPRSSEAEAEVDGAHDEAARRSTGKRTVDSFHRELGKIMWEYCGMARNEQGLKTALAEDPRAARGVLAGRERPGHGRGAEPVAGEGRAAWPTSWSSAS